MTSQIYLDIFIGNKEAFAQEEAAYDATSALLSKNASIYGLPSVPQELSEEQQDILKELDVSSAFPSYLLRWLQNSCVSYRAP